MAKRGENIYKRKDGRWEARAIRGYNEQGKAIYAYFYGRTYREAKDKMFMSLSFLGFSPNLLPQSAGDSINFGVLLDRWLDNSKIRLKESSYVKYHNLVRNHIKPALGKYPISGISSTVLNSFVADKLKVGKIGTPSGLSEKSVKDIVSVIKSALRFAKDESLIVDISINISLPKEKPKDMRILSTEEQTALERILCTDMDESKLGIYLCLYTGLRIGEICSLLWRDISLDKGMLTVNRTMQRIQALEADSSAKTKVITTDPKSNFSVREIPLPECLISKLRQLCPTTSGDTYLLTGEAGRYIEPRTLQNRFKNYLSKSGIKDANFHALRHTFATRCVALGFEIKSLSEILGHIDPKFRITPYHVAWPLRYTKIKYKVGDSHIPEHLMELKNPDVPLQYANSYADRAFTGKKPTARPKADLVNLLEGIKSKFDIVPYEVSRDDLMPEEADSYKDFLIDSLIEDIEYLSEKRELSLSVEHSNPFLCLSHKDANGTLTKIYFAYIATRRQIMFSYDDIKYLYEPGLLAGLLAGYVPAEVNFKTGFRRMLGLGDERHRRG